MCTLAICFRTNESLPLVVAANRDEFLARPSASPRPISDDPWVVAGQDLDAGGTWFGVNQHAMVVGLLNRRSSSGPDPTRRSRGLLCLETLQARGPAEALDRLRPTSGEDYNGFNLLIATRREAYVVSNPSATMQVTRLEPGVHLITNLTLNDPRCPRIARSHSLFRQLTLPADEREIGSLLARLRRILSDHTTVLDPRSSEIEPLCVHLSGYGTRSSTVVVHFAGANSPQYWHAPGPPCRADYARVALPDSTEKGSP